MWKYTLGLLVLITITIWLAAFFHPDQKLKLIACDVGQGDAILAVYGNTQILVDGGPNTKVNECLSKFMPFWDREIELVLLSHPQTDHYRGLLEVLKRYQVQTFLATPLDSSSQDYRVLKEQVGGMGVRVANPTTGTKVRVGSIHLDVLWPSEEFLIASTKELRPKDNIAIKQYSNNSTGVLGAFTSNRDPNDFSVVAILSFKDFDALLTGDIGPKISGQLAVNQLIREVEYIKVPHHGSKNGLTSELLEASSPDIAVISVGAKNSYGHPHKEILKILGDKDIRILRTDEMGDVQIVTDGKDIWVEK